MRKLLGLPLPNVHMFPAWLARQWRREFKDARIIVEQEGDIRYFSIPAWVQQRVARAAIMSTFGCLATILALFSASIVLHLLNARLESAQREIESVLFEVSDNAGQEPSPDLDRKALQNLAQSIRERDRQIRELIEEVTDHLAADSEQLGRSVASKGLTERVLNAMTPGGRPEMSHLDSPTHQPSLNALMEASSRNRSLRDALLGLPNRMPLANYRVTSDVGMRSHPISGVRMPHSGVDLVPTDGDDRIFPVMAGRVVLARSHYNYGNTVVVEHHRGIESLYAHLSSIHVTAGDEVDVTTVLGMVGNTGASTGKHLHFEIAIGGINVDPIKIVNTGKHVQQVQAKSR